MTNQNFAEGMIVWCDFNKNEIRLLEKIQTKIINFFEEDDKIIEKINGFFDNEKIKKLAKKQFKPEIWKRRPVLIIHLHERMEAAIVLH